GTVTYQSPSVERVLGYRVDEIEGSDFARFLAETDRPRLAQIVAGVGEAYAGGGSETHVIECSLRHRDGTWLQRRFDRVAPLAPEEPVLHVNWHEAQAYCAFAQRRLPSEAEWEYAAAWDANGEKRLYPWGSTSPDAAKANLESAGLVAVAAHADGDAASGCRQMIGNTWEWTSSAFEPYPGFEIDPYKEYSAPWFGTHKVLRGASFASSRRLPRNTFRNFYLPERSDIFAGFRTCAR
ncbi:MAG: SUMF1/EgtB/PvdO family nonheme iron enzyme, partial [Burkholderiales bacterium]